VIFAKDVEGRHLLINRRYETLFHVTRAGVRGKTDHEIFPPEIAEQLRAHDKKVMEAGTHLEVEEVVPQDDGPHTYISVKFPIYMSDGVILGTCGIATDVTEHRRAEQAKAELQRQIDLGGVRTLDTLQSGIAYALRR
jgi:PAS domain S-box-containing protein